MRRARLAIAVAGLLVFSAVPALAHGPGDPPHQRAALGDLKLESGDVIKDFEISYVTHGTLNAKKSNAILMVTAISGNHHRIDFLIGPGKALDTNKYFIVATDAIGNGLTTSPSTSKAQPRMKFPRFTMRDMVQSQQRLLTEKLGIAHVVTVIGASMGGMQALQWAVSHPQFMDSVVALVPLGRTPAWTTSMLEMSRRLIMTDPAWNKGDYTAPPEQGMRLWAEFLDTLIVQAPSGVKAQFPNNMDVPAWAQSRAETWKRFDANDWIYQTWAYDAHNLGTTPGFNGDYPRALRAIKAKTLVMAGQTDLLNPEEEVLEAARGITDARFVPINPPLGLGHRAAAAGLPAENEHINREVAAFLDDVTQRGRKLQ
ncbi:MAG: alpha/beta fold hydrolase [Candidatus Rokubacteria bacterium]|nr:alpha/beta fold hydrolase [Candidatus Rokubacteria bacterium]